MHCVRSFAESCSSSCPPSKIPEASHSTCLDELSRSAGHGDDVLKGGEVNRLGNVSEEPEPEDRFGRFALCAPARRNDRDRAVVLAELAHDRERIEPVHLGLEDDQIRAPLGERGDGLRGRGRGDHIVLTPVVEPREAVLQPWYLRLVVIEDEHSFRFHGSSHFERRPTPPHTWCQIRESHRGTILGRLESTDDTWQVTF